MKSSAASALAFAFSAIASMTALSEVQGDNSRPELRPRYILEEFEAGPFEANGTAGPKEWPKTRKALFECTNKIQETPSKLPCKSRIGFDGARLRFLITVDVDPATPLKTTGDWGARDGLELAFSDLGKEAPAFLLHGYPDGTFKISCPGAAAPAQVEALRKGVVYGAKTEEGKWTAELAIPLSAINIEPDTFQQLRFNMNIRRTSDNSWTCWWPPKRGIADLLSSGLLILPRKIPETAEMIRRGKAAAPLFDSEKAGGLKWRKLKNMTLTADPDRLGPLAQAAGAPKVSFRSYSGWAVARTKIRLTAKQLGQPSCALFFPCVDEEGEIYINGKLALSHTAKATGTAPGRLWREPFLVDLKKAGATPGDTDIAVHLRGNMGTGGLRKGVFLIWGKTPLVSQPLYDFLAGDPKRGRRGQVPPFWKDFARTRIPEIPPAQDQDKFGKRIQHTMNLLATSTAKKRNRVRIFFYGQSITQGMHSREMINVLRSRFPWAIIEYENRAIGGFGASSLVLTGEHDLYPRDADLLIFHVYGDAKSLDTIFSNVRKRNTSDILVYTHHYNWVPEPEKLRKKLKSLADSVAEWHALSEKYTMELAPVYRDWGIYLRANDMGANELIGDTVHGNVHHNTAGHTLLAKLVLRNFHHHPGNPETHPAAVRTVSVADSAVHTTSAWTHERGGIRTLAKGATLKLTFDGNRVDVIPRCCATPGTARIRIDGKSPSEFPELYYCTLPSHGPYIWMPAIKRVHLGKALLPQAEDWTLTPFDVDLKKKTFSFRLEGSITGFDGEGSKAADFVSNSGRIEIERKHLFIIWPCTYRKKDKLPDGYKATWQVRPLFADPWRLPHNLDPIMQIPITLVKGLSNGRHTLELIADGDGEVAIQEFIVHQPQLR